MRVTIESTAAKSSDVVEMTFQVPKTEVILDPSKFMLHSYYSIIKLLA